MKNKTALRIAAALEEGWGFANVGPPASVTRSGCIWVHAPIERGEYGQWTARKGSGKNWLEEALDQAGVPK